MIDNRGLPLMAKALLLAGCSSDSNEVSVERDVQISIAILDYSTALNASNPKSAIKDGYPHHLQTQGYTLCYQHDQMEVEDCELVPDVTDLTSLELSGAQGPVNVSVYSADYNGKDYGMSNLVGNSSPHYAVHGSLSLAESETIGTLNLSNTDWHLVTLQDSDQILADGSDIDALQQSAWLVLGSDERSEALHRMTNETDSSYRQDFSYLYVRDDFSLKIDMGGGYQLGEDDVHLAPAQEQTHYAIQLNDREASLGLMILDEWEPGTVACLGDDC